MLYAKSLRTHLLCKHCQTHSRAWCFWRPFCTWKQEKSLYLKTTVFLSLQAVFISCVVAICSTCLSKVSKTDCGFFFCTRRNKQYYFISFGETHNANLVNILYLIEYLFNKEYINKKVGQGKTKPFFHYKQTKAHYICS